MLLDRSSEASRRAIYGRETTSSRRRKRDRQVAALPRSRSSRHTDSLNLGPVRTGPRRPLFPICHLLLGRCVSGSIPDSRRYIHLGIRDGRRLYFSNCFPQAKMNRYVRSRLFSIIPLNSSAMHLWKEKYRRSEKGVLKRILFYLQNGSLVF